MQMAHQLLLRKQPAPPTDFGAPLAEVRGVFIEVGGTTACARSLCKVDEVDVLDWPNDVVPGKMEKTARS